MGGIGAMSGARQEPCFSERSSSLYLSASGGGCASCVWVERAKCHALYNGGYGRRYAKCQTLHISTFGKNEQRMGYGGNKVWHCLRRSLARGER